MVIEKFIPFKIIVAKVIFIWRKVEFVIFVKKTVFNDDVKRKIKLTV